MAAVWKPGNVPPVPQGASRPQFDPKASSTRVKQYAKNLGQQLDEAVAINATGMQEAWDYGAEYDEYGVRFPTQASIEGLNATLGIKGYKKYLDPSISVGPQGFEFQGEGAGIAYGDTEYSGYQGMAIGDYDIPTSTSNFKRPRTLAAGYDPNEQIVTVVFRDGTFYNYYGIKPQTWLAFKAAYSKGRMLHSQNIENQKNSKSDGLLVAQCTARGEADLSQLGEEAQRFFVTVARSAQIALRSRSARNAKGQFAKKNQGVIGSSKKGAMTASANVTAAKKAKNPSSGGKNRATANKPS